MIQNVANGIAMKNKEDYVKDFTETRSVCKYRRQHPRSLCGWNWKSWKAYDRCSKRGQNRKEHRGTKSGAQKRYLLSGTGDLKISTGRDQEDFME